MSVANQVICNSLYFWHVDDSAIELDKESIEVWNLIALSAQKSETVWDLIKYLQLWMIAGSTIVLPVRARFQKKAFVKGVKAATDDVYPDAVELAGTFLTVISHRPVPPMTALMHSFYDVCDRSLAKSRDSENEEVTDAE